MLITNKKGNSLILEIEGYEFPNIKNDRYDSNWLMVKVAVEHENGSWCSSNPSLLTWELDKLINWIEKVTSEENFENTVDFLEPNLSFVVLDSCEEKKIRVYFEMESRPHWSPHNGKIGRDLWVEFSLYNSGWDLIAESLKAQLAQFPQRFL